MYTCTVYKKYRLTKLIKYGFIGILAFIAEYSSFLLLISFFSPQLIVVAQAISFGLGLLISFIGGRLFTFKDEAKVYKHNTRVQLTSYFVLAGINIVLTSIAIFLLVHQLHILFWIAKIIVMISVVMWNYIVLNKIIFKTAN